MQSFPRRWAIIVFLLALALRGGWGAVSYFRAEDPSVLEFPDERQYWNMATSLRSGDGLRDELGFRATRMPLYPAFLSVFTGFPNGLVIAKGCQWLIGALAAVLAGGVASGLFGRRIGLSAALLVAFDPFLIFFSSLLLTETAFIAALTGLWWIATPIVVNRRASLRRWIGFGLIAALCVYLRESTLGLVAALVVLLLLRLRLHRRSIVGAAIVVGIVAILLLPWAARNRMVVGEWCWLTTRGGISLYDGVGPSATGASNLGSIKQMPAVEGLTEVQWNGYFLRESFREIRTDPGRVFRLARVKLARLWNPFPNVATHQSSLLRLISAAWNIPIFALAAVGALRLLSTGGHTGVGVALLLVLPAVYFSALHSLFVGSVRYRLGAMPAMEILAAFAALTLAARIREGFRAQRSGAGD